MMHRIIYWRECRESEKDITAYFNENFLRIYNKKSDRRCYVSKEKEIPGIFVEICYECAIINEKETRIELIDFESPYRELPAEMLKEISAFGFARER